MTARVLVAGIGNVFLGDDGFGVQVVRQIARGAIPEGVDVVDYGIRGVHLAYDLLGGPYGTVVLVDAAPVDGPPGTVAVLEVDTTAGADGAAEAGGEAGPAGGLEFPFPAAADPAAGALASVAPVAAGPGRAGDGRAAGSATATVAPPADPLPAPAFDAHGLDPASVLALLRGLGGHVDRVLVVGCRPASLEEGMSLSEPVAASVEMAARLTVELARNEAAALARAGERRNR